MIVMTTILHSKAKPTSVEPYLALYKGRGAYINFEFLERGPPKSGSMNFWKGSLGLCIEIILIWYCMYV